MSETLRAVARGRSGTAVGRGYDDMVGRARPRGNLPGIGRVFALDATRDGISGQNGRIYAEVLRRSSGIRGACVHTHGQRPGVRKQERDRISERQEYQLASRPVAYARGSGVG